MSMSNEPDGLVFWVNPSGAVPFPIDLREFADGRTRADLELRHQRAWAGDFRGRPGFAADMATWVHRVQPTIVASTGARSTLRNLLRFLDKHDPEMLVRSCRELQDHHGVLLYTSHETAGIQYSKIKLLVDALRSQQDAPPLFWPARPRDAITQVEEVDAQGVKRLYNALKKEAMC